jgi:hypothetical protein
MRPSHLASGSLALSIALLLPADGLAQTPAAIDSMTATVRTLLHGVRESADGGDWDAMKDHFPSAWAAQVEGQVTAPQGVSFWQPRTRMPYGDFTVEMVATDIATVGANFLVGDAIGTWGAVLIRDSGEWRFHCYSEMFGPWKDPPRVRTGCVRPMDPA